MLHIACLQVIQCHKTVWDVERSHSLSVKLGMMEEIMLKAQRRAEVSWEGSLIQGKGKVVSVGSGALKDLPLTWASRTERSDGRTSPEELIAAAHAGCYAMAFSNVLAQAGTPAEQLLV